MARTLEARNIRKSMLNGRKVKLFQLWQLESDGWWFYGHHSAPARAPNASLCAHAVNSEIDAYTTSGAAATTP